MRYKVVIKSGEILLPSGCGLWCALLPLNFSNRGTVQLVAFIAAAGGWLILSNTEVNEETLQRLETEYKPPAEHSFRMLRDFANRASKWKQRLPLFVACSILVALSGLFMS
jgi:hypothetical protein